MGRDRMGQGWEGDTYEHTDFSRKYRLFYENVILDIQEIKTPEYI